MILIFIVALVVVRIMGNRAVGQLSPFDFVLMVGIGDIVANVAMDKNQSILAGAEALGALLLLQQVLARLSLKSLTLRKWFEGIPVKIVQDGQVLRENLKNSQFNLDDLRQELHKQGLDFTNLKDIKLARLESCGDFSVVKIPETQPLTKRDLEAYLKNIYDNPLSPIGQKWIKMEQFMDDVHFLVERTRDQQPNDTNVFPNTEHMDNLH
jgi:uncharacterized membrane protein YcaP (DUF421 family)